MKDKDLRIQIEKNLKRLHLNIEKFEQDYLKKQLEDNAKKLQNKEQYFNVVYSIPKIHKKIEEIEEYYNQDNSVYENVNSSGKEKIKIMYA